MKNSIETLETLLDEARAQAKKDGYVAPDGTYTLNNHDASVVSLALELVVRLVSGEDNRAALLILNVLRSHGPVVVEILDRISKEIMDKQCPPYIDEVRDKMYAAINKTDKSLS